VRHFAVASRQLAQGQTYVLVSPYPGLPARAGPGARGVMHRRRGQRRVGDPWHAQCSFGQPVCRGDASAGLVASAAGRATLAGFARALSGMLVAALPGGCPTDRLMGCVGLGEDMVMRRLLLAFGAALLVLIALAPASLASEDWCSTDPLMVLTTPDGSTVPVYVLTTAPPGYLGDLARATYSYTAAHYVRDAAGDLGTVFTVYVTVPNDPVTGAFGMHDAVDSEPAMGASAADYQMVVAPGVTYVSTSALSGVTVGLTFDYPQP
jgi:hypothetical protein